MTSAHPMSRTLALIAIAALTCSTATAGKRAKAKHKAKGKAAKAAKAKEAAEEEPAEQAPEEDAAESAPTTTTEAPAPPTADDDDDESEATSSEDVADDEPEQAAPEADTGDASGDSTAKPDQPPKPAKPPGKIIAALVIIVEGETRVPKEIADGIRGFFHQAASFYKEIEVRTGDKVKKKVRRRIVKCKGEIVCVARVGARNKLHEVIVARAEKLEGGKVAVTFQAIRSDTAEVVREERVEIPSAQDTKAQIARHFFAISGITTPGYLEIPDAPPSIVVDGQPTDTTIGPIRLKPGPHTVTVQGETRETIILPDEMRKMSLGDFGIEPAPPPPDTTQPTDQTTVAAADPTPAPPPAVEETVESPTGPGFGTVLNRPLTLAGMGAGVVGLALVGVGAGFGSGAKADISADTSQAEAARRNRDARDAASRANLMFGIGGGLVAVGATLVIVDTFVLDHDGPETAIDIAAEPTDGGVQLWLGGSF